MAQTFKVDLSANKIYKVTIYKSLGNRWCIKHPSYRIHNKDFASLAYAKVFCKRQGWQFDVQ
jgi:hypothetical protein